MKYKIIITTYKNGRQEFQAYFGKLIKRFFVFEDYQWTGLSFKGEEGYALRSDSREEALKHIDLHFKGNTIISSITLEYINI